MKQRILIIGLCTGLGLLAGCDNDRNDVDTVDTTAVPATTTPPPQPDVPPPSETMPATTTAQTPDMNSDTAMAAGQTYQATGTITAIDTTANTVTIDHDAVAALNWPAMSMTFQVDDPTQLPALKQGEQVEFAFVKSGDNAYLIQEINPGDQAQMSQQGEE